MESTQRVCAAPECKRKPRPGWAFCEAHLEPWLDRVMRVNRWQHEDVPDYLKPIDELEQRVLDGNR